MSLNKKLIEACKNQDIEEIKNLISQGADVNEKDKNNKTLLIFASYNGNKEIIDFLISNGANVNDKDSYAIGYTALMYANIIKNKEIIKLLKSRK